MSSRDALAPWIRGADDPVSILPYQTEFAFSSKQDSAAASPSTVTPVKGATGNVTGGGFVDYYLREVKYPQRGGESYVAECDDLIAALNLSFDEGEIFKEIWRTACQRMGTGKPGNTLLRSREKIFHRAKRLLDAAKRLG